MDDPAGGRDGLGRAERLLAELAGERLVRGAVAVGQADAASDDLLRAGRALADRYGVPFTLHAAQNRREVVTTLAAHGTTPLRRLHRLGVLRPGTVLAHAVFLDHHPAVGRGAEELALLAASGAAVAHSPRHLALRGDALLSFSRYRGAGVPVGIGTDTAPRDLLAEASLALLIDRAISGADGARAEAVLDAATSVGADALGRPDLGRLRVGGPADLVVVDLRTAGAVRDPVRTAVEQCTRHEVEHVFVAGAHVVQGGVVPGLDGPSLREAAQHEADELARTAPRWHRLGRTAEDLAPSPYPHATAAAVAPPMEVMR